MKKGLIIMMVLILIIGSIVIFKDDIKETISENEPPENFPDYDENKLKIISQGFGEWNGRPETEGDWGSVAAQIRNYIGYNPNDEDDGYGRVFGFFKGYNIGLGTGESKNGWSIRVLREYVKDYLKTSNGQKSDRVIVTGEYL